MSKIFQGPIIAAGGFEPDTAEAAVANGDASLISFGRHFIANPDLPKRIEFGLPLNRYDRSTFYGFDAHGYTDYPTYEQRESKSSELGKKLARDYAGPFDTRVKSLPFSKSFLASSRLQTGVLPRLTTYFRQRTEAVGFTGTSCRTTRKS